MSETDTIDAHQHFWRYDPVEYDWISGPEMQGLRRDFLPDDLKLEIGRAGVGGTVAVQARQSLEETEWLLALAGVNPWIRGVVGWVPLTAPDIGERLDRLTAVHPRLRGVRHVLQGESDDYLSRDDLNAGIGLLADHGLTYDLLITARQLPAAIALVDRHPDQSFILDHCAKPPIRDGTIEPWRTQLRQMAERVNVVCKLSGLVTEADPATWSPGSLQPFVEAALESFGPDRLMFGSDWPVCTIASSYARWHWTAQDFTSGLSPTEHAALYGGTAIRVYGLGGL